MEDDHGWLIQSTMRKVLARSDVFLCTWLLREYSHSVNQPAVPGNKISHLKIDVITISYIIIIVQLCRNFKPVKLNLTMGQKLKSKNWFRTLEAKFSFTRLKFSKDCITWNVFLSLLLFIATYRNRYRIEPFAILAFCRIKNYKALQMASRSTLQNCN